MNEITKNILKCLAEIVLGTMVWCGLDYFTGEPLNIVENLLSVSIIVLLCNLTDYLVKKFKKKK